MDALNKRKRSKNFTNNDLSCLINIVAKYKHIIENKKTDAVTVKEKQRTWEKITKEYNCLNVSSYRETECLKRCYDNRKKMLRKSVAQDKREMYKTGGGLPDVKESRAPTDELLLSIVCDKGVSGLENPFDGDRTQKLVEESPDCSFVQSAVQTVSQDLENIEFVFDDSSNETDAIIAVPTAISENRTDKMPSQKETRYSYKVSDLQSPPKTPATPMADKASIKSRRRPRTLVKPLSTSVLSEKYDTLLSERLEIAALEKQRLQNMMDIEKREHDLKAELLRIQIEREKKCM